MSDRIALVLALSLLAVPAAALLFSPPREQIPIHWNVQGEPDSFIPPEQAPLLVAGAALVVVAVWGARYADPLRENVERFRGAYNAFVIALSAALSILLCGTFLGARGVVFPTVGAILVAAGIVMMLSERNWTLGLRTPWTLSSEHAWKAANREAGAVTIIAGIAMALRPEDAWLALIFLLTGYAVATVHAFLIWRGKRKVFK